MIRPNRKWRCWNLMLYCAAIAMAWQWGALGAVSDETEDPLAFRGGLFTANNIDAARLQQLHDENFQAVVLAIDIDSRSNPDADCAAAELIMASGFDLYYWVEIARCPELADAHPQWMASLQTHDQWRRLFPDAPQPATGEVIKTYPWVPVLSREPFTGQLARVKRLLTARPKPAGVFLNDLQGAPSACGCGNPLCRWTSDYGKRRTTTPLGDDAAALFVEAVQEMLPRASVIPVWTTECERHDGAKDGMCAGVGCFDGICWKAYTKQLLPLQQTSKTLAVLAPFRELGRDLPRYGPTAGWVGEAIKSFAEMPPKHGGQAIAASRMVAVLQGWNVTAADVDAQVKMARQAGALGYVVAFSKIEQGWQPKLVRLR